MKLVSWNVNGLRAIEKKGFSDIMKDFDIVKKLLKELGFNSYCTFKNKKIEYRDLDI